MPVLSSIFLVVAFALAVVIGPQTRAWSWGPAMLALAISVAAAVPSLWTRRRAAGEFGLLASGVLVVGWFAWRAWISPVAALGQADLMLLAAATGAFIIIRAMEGVLPAERILGWGLALLLLANVLAIGRQVVDPSFNPVFRSRGAQFPSGFYAHYNEAANFLIASSLLVGASALFGIHRGWTRVLFALIALTGLIAVWFTNSRSGILTCALSTGIFWLLALIIGKRRNSPWFIGALIGGPLLALGLGGVVYLGWQHAQEVRNITGGVQRVLDNNSRLYFLGAAISCISLHPIAGGGSRSFSWEYFRFAENKLQGDIITHVPEQVHNEFLQAATDYGIVGAGLLVALLGALTLVAFIRIIFAEQAECENSFKDAWRLGGLAAMAAMLILSCFNFGFHLLPGAMLLGICLGLLSRSSSHPEQSAKISASSFLLTAAALGCAAVLVPFGWKGTQVTRWLWPTHFSKHPLTTIESRVDALTPALGVWPDSSLYQERGELLQESSALEVGARSVSQAEGAIADYQKAEDLNPYDPRPVINRANTLSRLGRDAEAEEAYDRAMRLQGGMEPGFRARYSLANHFLRKGVRQFSAEYPDQSLATFENAAAQMEEAAASHWDTIEMRGARVSAQESLGAVREANGDYVGALQAYEFAVTLPEGGRAFYRAGILYGKKAATAWAARKPSEALGYFLKARERISRTKELPEGVTPQQRLDYLAYLDETIAYLKGAKIEPPASLPE